MSPRIAERDDADEREQLDEQAGREPEAGAHPRNVSVGVAGVHVIVPALDEEAAIGDVVQALRAAGFDDIVVVDNDSRDRTAAIARAHGARVIAESRRGYGAACLAGIAALGRVTDDDIVAFMDADGSDDAEDLRAVVAAVADDRADLVLGSRSTGRREIGAQPAHARFGNRFACALLRLRTGMRYTDLGPMRALRYATLRALAMQDRDYGWTVEMQLKAARLRVLELPVSYRPRIGRSKISGSVIGSVRAGAKILWLIARHGR